MPASIALEHGMSNQSALNLGRIILYTSALFLVSLSAAVVVLFIWIPVS
jgi:hypothetical protein